MLTIFLNLSKRIISDKVLCLCSQKEIKEIVGGHCIPQDIYFPGCKSFLLQKTTKLILHWFCF